MASSTTRLMIEATIRTITTTFVTGWLMKLASAWRVFGFKGECAAFVVCGSG